MLVVTCLILYETQAGVGGGMNGGMYDQQGMHNPQQQQQGEHKIDYRSVIL